LERGGGWGPQVALACGWQALLSACLALCLDVFWSQADTCPRPIPSDSLGVAMHHASCLALRFIALQCTASRGTALCCFDFAL